MTDSLTALRQLVAGMTKDGVARCINSDARPFAIINPNGRFGDEITAGFLSEEDAKAFVAGARALRLLADEATVEELAVAGINEWYAFTNDNMGVQERWEIAMRAVIAHLAAQIVGEG